MAGITLATATEMLNLYIEAEKAVLKGQRYKIGNRELARPNLREIALNKKEWQSIVDSLTNGGSIRPKRFIPRDT